jgi:hypothetical protein
MMDINNTTSGQNGNRAAEQRSDKALFMREQNERISGSSPEWRSARSAREESVFRLSESALNSNEQVNGRADSPYVQSFQGYMLKSVPEDKAYGFGDMVDMVNPLHHIPVVGSLYRGITGDEINPAGRVIGGAVFGGALGTAASLANIISEQESGHDIPDLMVDQFSRDAAHGAYSKNQ